MLMRIATHDGTFHADEVFATAVLKEVYPDATFIRTRDPEVLGYADIIYDVGLEFDGSSKFDHHQPIKQLREDKLKTPYSSFGLIWRAFGHQFIGSAIPALDSARIEEVVQNIDSKIVFGVDAADNGKSISKTWDVTRIISSMNSLHAQGLCGEESFAMAVGLARAVLISQATTEMAAIKAEQYVHDSYNSREEKEILVLPAYCDWSNILLDIDADKEVLFTVFPNNAGDGYRVMAVPSGKGNYISRKLLPENWRGKSVAELNEIVGVTDAQFCHADLFICGFGTRESALKAARLAAGEKFDLKLPGF